MQKLLKTIYFQNVAINRELLTASLINSINYLYIVNSPQAVFLIETTVLVDIFYLP